MREVRRSALVSYSAEQMYALVNDVAAYSDFLPWCSNSRVLEASEHHMRAEIEMTLAGLTRRFSTHNTLSPHTQIDIQLVNGPFRHLEGHWHFQPLKAGACKVTVDLQFQVSSGVFDAVLTPAFERVCNMLMDHFIRRAEAVYGQR